MVVKRVADLDIHRRAFITAIGGNIDDSFIDEDLCSYAFEQQLYLYLKKEGYNRILFYNRASGFNLYAYDRESLTSLYPDNNHKETTKGGPLGKVNLLGKPAKTEDNNASDSNVNIKSRDYNGRKYFYISNFKDTTLVETVQDVMRNTTYKSVIFFTSTSFDLGERQTFIDSISHTYNEVAALGSPNKILIRYNTSGIFKSDFFVNVLKSSENVFNIGTPDKQEYKNWLNAQRIKGNISAEAIFSFPINALTDQLCRLGQKIKALDTELQLKQAGFIDGLKPRPFDKNKLFEELKKVKGQQDNIQVIVGELNRWLRKATKTKPLVFMFAGTSGTGKTFTTKCIHASLASSGFNFIRLNMNEYHSENDARKLLGSPQGYVDSEKDAPLFAAHKKSGGKLVILFDEVEKAHPSLFTTIMALMDEGTLSNGKGEEYNFKQSIIIFTTNLAQERLLSQKQRLISQHIEITNRQFQDTTKQILKNAGLPNEICGRINWLLVYNALDASTTAQIALEQIRMVGKEYNITINSVPLSYLQEIAEECAGNNEGARPIESSIRNRLEPIFQDAYDANVCLPDVIYDIDDQFQLALSNEDKWISLDDIVINTSKTIQFDKGQLIDSLNAVKGQQDNVQLIADEISIWIRDSFKEAPLVFMLAGTSGTGKTFTVETIDRALPEYKMVKLNMNEYHSEADSWKLLGSSTGYVGSDKESPLFAARRETDKLIILFDEIEKAHPSLFTTIMTLMEKGEMGNGHGEIFDFKESLIFFTTNLAMKELLKYKQNAIKNNVPVSSPAFQDAAKNILKTAGLKDEISGRVTWLLIYNSLDISVVGQIALEKIRQLGIKYGIKINAVSNNFLKEVAIHCAGNNEGARPINRMVTRKIKPIFQDAYNTKSCLPDAIYDIDDNFRLILSNEKLITPLENYFVDQF